MKAENKVLGTKRAPSSGVLKKNCAFNYKGQFHNCQGRNYKKLNLKNFKEFIMNFYIGFPELIIKEVRKFLDTFDDYSTEELESLLKGWNDYVEDQISYERIEYAKNCFLYLSKTVEGFLEIFYEYKHHISNLDRNGSLDRTAVSIIYGFGVKVIEFIRGRKKGEYDFEELEEYIDCVEEVYYF